MVITSSLIYGACAAPYTSWRGGISRNSAGRSQSCSRFMAEDDGVRRTGRMSELPVGVGQLPEEVEEIVEGRDAVVLAAQRSAPATATLSGSTTRQVGGHVEVGAGRDGVAELELGLGQRLGHARIGRAGLVAREDADGSCRGRAGGGYGVR